MTDYNPNQTENTNTTTTGGTTPPPVQPTETAPQATPETTAPVTAPAAEQAASAPQGEPVQPVPPAPDPAAAEIPVPGTSEPERAAQDPFDVPVPDPLEMPMPEQPQPPRQEAYPYVSPEIQGVRLTLETDPPEPQYHHPPEPAPQPPRQEAPPYYGAQQNNTPPRYQPPQYVQRTYQPPRQTYYQPVYYPPQGYQQKSRLAAAVLALTLGCLGIHNFYLGFKNRAVIQLLICTVGSIFFGLGFFAALIWGFVEGILLLVGNETRRFDGNGVILKE